MNEQWLMNDAWVRLAATLCLFLLLALLESRFPRRPRTLTRRLRWWGNWTLQLINAAVLRLFVPWLLPVAIAVAARQQNAGLLNLLSVPEWAAIAVSLVLLDLLIYWQHRLMHRFPLLWRLHRLHHSDLDLDVTTALRFHPFEIVLSVAIKSAAVWLCGMPAEAVVLFAVLLNGMAMFNHANLKLPATVDNWLRKLLVTPDMHRVHHSVMRREHNSNFGFNLSCWDRWFGSYRAQPERGHLGMELGLDETKGQNIGSVIWMLKQPLQ